VLLYQKRKSILYQRKAEQGFTPSVFSLDLPTKGNSEEEKEAYKRDLNLKLIHLMIKEILMKVSSV
jgi:hypothetical protein